MVVIRGTLKRASSGGLGKYADTATRSVGTAKKVKQAASDLSEAEQETIQDIVLHLQRNPREIFVCYAACIRGKFSMQVEAGSLSGDVTTERTFPNTYTTFKFLPKYWVADFMKTKLGMSSLVVDAVDAHQKLRPLFTFFTGIVDTTCWPPCAHRKDVLTAFVLDLVQYMGGRHQGFAHKHVGENGDINFSACGPWKLHWSEDGSHVTEIEHIGGAKAPRQQYRLCR